MNMDRPETSMVVPTSAAEKWRICARNRGSRKVPPNRLNPETKVMTIPSVKLRSWNGARFTIGCL